VTWERLAEALGRGDAGTRARTTLLVVPGSDDMTLRQLREARSRAEAAATRAGLKGLDVMFAAAAAETNPAGARPAEKKPAAKIQTELPEGPGSTRGTYYVGGDMTRPGAYEISPRGVRLRPALVAAGLPEGARDNYEVFVSRTWGDKQELFRLALAEVLEEKSRNGSAWLRDGDQVLLSPRKDGKAD
jgi:hypothetical protein